MVLLVGALHGLAFSLPGPASALIPLAQAGLFAVLWWLLARLPVKPVFSLALLFGIGNFVAGLAWLYISMHRFGGMPSILAACAVVLLAAYLGLFGAAALACARKLVIRFGRNGSAGPFTTGLLVAACWGLGEIARGFALTGFPWLSIGYAHIDSLFSALAPLTGVYGISIAVVLIAVWVVELLRTTGRPPRARLTGAAAIAALLGAIGSSQMLGWAEPSGGPVSVRLLQGNVPQSLKFDRNRAQRAVSDYVGMIAGSSARLTILPETAFTQPLSSLPAETRMTLAAALERSGTTVAIGMPMASTSEQARANPRIRLTNSIASYSPDGQPLHRYDKRHLVPFGEYIPTGFAWFVNMMNIPLGEFGRGALVQPQLELDGQHFAFNICYEDLFGEELARHVRQGANVLVNVSNIAWFGDSHALPQHLAISRMRTLELGRPMLRATNTGVTAAIDHRGQVTARLPNYEQGALDVTVQPTGGLTPFARLGMLVPLALAAAMLLIGVALARVDRIER